MSSTGIFVGLPEGSKSSIIKVPSDVFTSADHSFTEPALTTSATNTCAESFDIGVPNAPKSCIAEIFNADHTDGSPVKMGSNSRPRVVRDTPTRPRDTHSRLFGQGKAVNNANITPMITDTIRSNIHFGNSEAKVTNGGSPPASPNKMNGSVRSSPSRGEPGASDNSSYQPPRRNPVTGDGVPVPTLRRCHPDRLRGADHDSLPLLEPQPQHRYVTTTWPPKPADYYVASASKPYPYVRHTPYSLLGLNTDDSEIEHPIIDSNSFSPQLIDRHWPPFPAQHYREPKQHKIVHPPLPMHAFVGMTSALGERPKPEHKYNQIPALDGPIDPFLIANTNPPPTLFKYERDAPIPDVSLLPTDVVAGPHTLTGFPPIFHKHVPGYLFDRYRHANDMKPQTLFVDYVRERAMEGNPITGDGYKSMNGQINTVTSINGHSLILHNRVPPGGYSSGLW